MKKIFTLVLSVFPMIASGDYLDDKIAELTKQKLEKIAELEECQKSTKGLKIAGITTLGVSTIGIAANIGEAVTLKKLDKDISTAEASKQDLDKQIQAQKAKNAAEQQAANNTCGVQTCNTAEKNAKMEMLNAKTVVCVNGEWRASQCKDGFSGTAATCTLNTQSVTYYTNCVQSQGGDKEGVAAAPKQYDFCSPEETQKINGAKKSWYNSNGKCIAYSCKENWFLVAENGTSKGRCIEDCPEHQRVKWNDYDTMACDSAKSQEEKPCPKIDDAWKEQNHVEQVECDTTTGQNYITQCKDGYVESKGSDGKILKCKLHVDEVKIYEVFGESKFGGCALIGDFQFGPVMEFSIEELKKYFDAEYDVGEYIDTRDQKFDLKHLNGRYYYAETGKEFNNLEEIYRYDNEVYCESPKYNISRHIIEYVVSDNLRYGIARMFQITVEVSGLSISSSFGRNINSLLSEVKDTLERQGYKNFDLVEKK